MRTACGNALIACFAPCEKRPRQHETADEGDSTPTLPVGKGVAMTSVRKPARTAVPDAARCHPELSAVDVRVLRAIAWHDREGAGGLGCIASNIVLGRRAECHPDSVRRSLRQLIKVGHVKDLLATSDGRRRHRRHLVVVYGTAGDSPGPDPDQLVRVDPDKVRTNRSGHVPIIEKGVVIPLQRGITTPHSKSRALNTPLEASMRSAPAGDAEEERRERELRVWHETWVPPTLAERERVAAMVSGALAKLREVGRGQVNRAASDAILASANRRLLERHGTQLRAGGRIGLGDVDLGADRSLQCNGVA
jgi:hypothetical protein